MKQGHAYLTSVVYVHIIWGQRLFESCAIKSVSNCFQRPHDFRMGGCRLVAKPLLTI